jgi:Kef-type K+ transport system membrane component KefB
LAAITTGFLAPIFFASIGLELNLDAVVEVPLFLSILIVIAFLGKLVGAAIPAMLLGISPRDAWAVGTAMSARGAVELIIAGIALRAGLFELGVGTSPIVDNLFSSVVIVAIVTTLVAPIGLRIILSARARENTVNP